MIHENMKSYNGKKIIRYQAGDKINPEFGYTLYQEYEEGNENTIINALKHIIKDGMSEHLNTLIIGCWYEPYEMACQNTIDFLTENSEKFKNLTAFFCGDMVSEECEISWIIQGNYEKFLASFPQLHHFGVRGGGELKLGVIDHPHLQTLLIESGGLSRDVVHSIMTAQLPSLRKLELWLGTDEYGGDSEVNQLRPLLFAHQFPQLTHLGLMNCDYVDEIALTLKDANVIQQLHTLDLSMGTLSNNGAQELLHNEQLKQLKYLNVRFHYLNDEWVTQLKSHFGDIINLDDPQDEDDYDGEVYRYVEVSE